jgi:hypothetical protein
MKHPPKMTMLLWLLAGILLIRGTLSFADERLSVKTGFTVDSRHGTLAISYAGQPVAKYVYADEKILRPYFTRLCVPGGIQVTRNHPPQTGDATDHGTMHPGLWLAFGDASGHDFWRNKAAIKHLRFVERPAVRNGRLVFVTENELQALDGTVIGVQVSRFVLEARPEAYLLTWEAAFTSGERELVFGDQEEMGLGVRVATAMTEKNGGAIRGSTGATGAKATWGSALDWCDYSGTIDGRQVGVTVMPDPANFRPSWFHNRDYGLMVANPFGRKAMTGGEPSRVTVKKGQSLRLRFGVLLHATAGGQRIDVPAVYRTFAEDSENAG